MREQEHEGAEGGSEDRAAADPLPFGRVCDVDERRVEVDARWFARPRRNARC